MICYYVESYASDGSYTEPDVLGYDTMAEAMREAARRVDRATLGAPDWTPDVDMRPPGVPDGAVPLGAWHESPEQGCGGSAIWGA